MYIPLPGRRLLVLCGLVWFGTSAEPQDQAAKVELKVSWARGQSRQYDATEKENRIELDRRIEKNESIDYLLSVTGVNGTVADVSVIRKPRTSSIKIFDRKTDVLKDESSNTDEITFEIKLDDRYRPLPAGGEADKQLKNKLLMTTATIPSLVFQPTLPKQNVKVGDKWNDEFFVPDPVDPQGDLNVIKIPVTVELKSLQDALSGQRAELSYTYSLTMELPKNSGDIKVRGEGKALVQVTTGILIEKEERLKQTILQFSVVNGAREKIFEFDSDKTFKATLK